MSRTWLGNVALTSAAIDDVLAWSLLAIVVTIIGSAAGSQWLPLLFAPYLVLMATVVRPALAWILTRRRVTAAGSPGALAVTIAGLLASAAFTEWIGLHFIFGAFLFGVVMPRGAAPDPPADGPGALGDQISRVNNILLLPVFFVVAGLKVNLTGMSAKDVVDLCVILVVAVAGKFLGAFVAARLCGLRSNEAGALAILMNTRGLTELIILTVGLQLGVLDARLYSDMVVMALVTTAMAGPLLQAVYPLRSTPPGVDPSVISGPPASPTAR
jgi:Kef-type K+ transport system membrane component KefB